MLEKCNRSLKKFVCWKKFNDVMERFMHWKIYGRFGKLYVYVGKILA